MKCALSSREEASAAVVLSLGLITLLAYYRVLQLILLFIPKQFIANDLTIIGAVYKKGGQEIAFIFTVLMNFYENNSSKTIGFSWVLKNIVCTFRLSRATFRLKFL